MSPVSTACLFVVEEQNETFLEDVQREGRHSRKDPDAVFLRTGTWRAAPPIREKASSVLFFFLCVFEGSCRRSRCRFCWRLVQIEFKKAHHLSVPVPVVACLAMTFSSRGSSVEVEDSMQI